MTDIVWSNVTVTLGQLQPWERNPKSISKSHARRLLASWDKFGQFQTVAIGPGFEVYDGHQRLSVLRAAYGDGYQVAARQSSRELTDSERRELVIAAHVGTTGQFNWDELANWDAAELQDWGLDGETLQDWKTGIGALTELIEAAKPEPAEDAGAQIDKAEELREKWGVESGQMWKLGEHRLICGDCTDKAVVDKVMQGERASVCVTDPPYGVNYDPSWRGEDLNQTVHGEKIAGDEGFEWLQAFEHVPADVLYVWLASYWLARVQFGIEKFGFITKYLIIWNKDLAVFGRGNYHWKHEPCLYMVRNGATLNWQGARDQSTVWDIPTIHSFKNGHNSEEWGLLGHCNQKPIECMERPIRNNSASGEIVLDLFLGSGTTLIACERLGRKCRAVEISPAYVAVSIQRWVDMTGGTPELITDAQ